MLKVDQATLDRFDDEHPGLSETIRRFEEAELAPCPQCGSDDTASVECGIVGRTLKLVFATTKVKLLPNGPKPGEVFCNSCGTYFDSLLSG